MSPPGVLRRRGFLREEPRRPFYWPHWADAEQWNVSNSQTGGEDFYGAHLMGVFYCDACGHNWTHLNEKLRRSSASGSRRDAAEVCGARLRLALWPQLRLASVTIGSFWGPLSLVLNVQPPWRDTLWSAVPLCLSFLAFLCVKVAICANSLHCLRNPRRPRPPHTPFVGTFCEAWKELIPKSHSDSCCTWISLYICTNMYTHT